MSRRSGGTATLAGEGVSTTLPFERSLRTNSKDPVLRVGLVSDIQHADIDNLLSFAGNERFYRHTIYHLQHAAACWNEEKVDFVVNCGDVIDMHNRDRGTVEESMARVLTVLSKVNAPVHHVLGNHCVGCLQRDQLQSYLRLPTTSTEVGFYSVSPNPSWRFLMLDSSDISLSGRSRDHPYTQLAINLLMGKNPNSHKSDNSGLTGTSKRFVGFGGGISGHQISWLHSELADAAQREQNVVVSCHIPLIEGLFGPTCLVWNYDEVLEVLQQYPNVQLAMYGHTHQMAYLRDDTGIHHMVIPGLIESKPRNVDFGCLRIYDERIEVVGFGREALILPLKNIHR